MPVIEGKYRIAKGRENTAIGGSRYGGIAALYVGLNAPLVFGKVLSESPPLADGKMGRETSPLAIGPIKVFIGFGGKEFDAPGANEAEVKMIHLIEANLMNALYSPSEVRFVLDPDAHHNEEAWAKRRRHSRSCSPAQK